MGLYFFKIYFLLFYVMGALPACTSVHYKYVMASEVRRQLQIP